MKALDFEYDGTLASSKGIVVCSFDSSDDETIDYGSKINFDVTSMRNGKEFELVNSGLMKQVNLLFKFVKILICN